MMVYNRNRSHIFTSKCGPSRRLQELLVLQGITKSTRKKSHPVKDWSECKVIRYIPLFQLSQVGKGGSEWSVLKYKTVDFSTGMSCQL